MKRLSIIALSLGLLSALYAGPALAVSLDFAPNSVVVGGVGDTFDVDVVVSNLGGEIVSAYDFDVLYDAALLNATAVAFGTSLGDPAFFETFQAATLSAGAVNLAELSLLSDADLAALQSGPVTLATISFEVIAGTGAQGTELTFGPGGEGTIDIKGLNAAKLNVGARPIPEPSSAVLFVVGALIAGGAIRKKVA